MILCHIIVCVKLATVLMQLFIPAVLYNNYKDGGFFTPNICMILLKKELAGFKIPDAVSDLGILILSMN